MKKMFIYLTTILLLISFCLILPASAITLTSPNGGEHWQAGTTQTITWSWDSYRSNYNVQINLYRQVKILRRGGYYTTIQVFEKTIGSSVVTEHPHYIYISGSYTWQIPTDQNLGDSYIVEVKDLSDSSYDRSDRVFAISGLHVTSPNGGEAWQAGTTHKITWTQGGLTGTSVKLDLLSYPPFSLRPSRSSITLSELASKGFYDWKIPAGQGQGSRYRVEVTDLSYPTIADRSDAYFTISKSSSDTITVTSPKAGDGWLPGTTHTIMWTSIGAVGPNVKIELLQANVPVGTANPNTPNDGSQDWAISATRAAGTNYKIRVTSLTTGISGTSGEFTIGQPTTTPKITVTSPNGGETWKRGIPHTITWSFTSYPGPYVKIELLQGGTPVGTATYSTSIGSHGIGSYPWTISSTRAPGTTYRIRVTSVSQPTISDTSNGDFTITT